MAPRDGHQPARSYFSDLLNKEQVDMKIQSLRLQIVQINDEIRSLEEYKNNQYLPVSKLPPEVLSIIFEFIIFEFIAMTIDDDLEPYSELLSATQVCRLWRQVALDSPRIWSFINCSATPCLVDLFLERSKSAPLHLLSWDYEVPFENVENVLTHLYRLKEITLLNYNADWPSRIISQGAPQLESLLLANYAEIQKFHPVADSFPVLQHLELDGFIYTSTMASLTTLRSLTIKAEGCDDRSQLPSCVEFLTILGSLPNLSKLSLTDALAQSEGPLPMSSVRLAHLTRLYVEDADIRNLGIMACIAAPQLKAIELGHSGAASAEIATPIVAAIFEKLPSVTASYSELSLFVDGCSGAGVELWNDSATGGSGSPFFQMTIHGTGDLRTEESVFDLCPSTTPPTLHFPSDIPFASDHAQYAALRRVLRQLTRVTEVRTRSFAALTHVLDDAHPVSLPSLKQIVLQPDYSGEDKQKSLAKFAEQLKVRKGLHDVEIETFVIFDTRKQIKPADLKQFEGLVKVECRNVKPGERRCNSVL